MFRSLRLLAAAVLVVPALVVATDSLPAGAVDVPGVPTALLPSLVTSTSATISWTAPAANGGSVITGYEVYRDGVKLTRVSKTSYAATGLSPLVGYSFTVRSCNAVGCSADSEALLVVAKPSPPGGMRAVVSSETAVISWSEAAAKPIGTGVTYSLWYRVSSAPAWIEWTPGTDDAPAGTTVSGLVNGTTYAFRVRATAASGYSDSTALLATPMAAPGVPTLSATGMTDKSVTLAWSIPATVGAAPSSYDVYKDGAKVGSTNTKTYTVTGLTTLTSYSFTVRACNAIGCSQVSAAYTTTIPPPAPTKAAGVVGPRKVTLTWTNSPSATSHSIWYKAATSLTWLEWTPGQNDTSGTEVTGLTGSVSYNFRIAANGDANNTAFTQVLTFIPQGAPAQIKTPRQTAATATSVTVMWVAPLNGGLPIISNKVLLNGVVAATPSASATTATLSGLIAGNRYTLEIQACNAIECSPSSPAIDVVTVPTAATDTQVVKNAISASVSWSASSSSVVSGYKVFYRQAGKPTWSEVTPALDDVSPTAITGLLPVTAYEVFVRTYNAGGSADTGVVAFTTPYYSAPTAPLTPTATAKYASAHLVWASPSDNGQSAITDYEFLVSADDGATWTTFDDGVSQATSTTITGLTPGSSYLFKVRARNIAGASPYATTTSAVVPFQLPGAPTGVSALAGNTQATVTWVAPANNGGDELIDYAVQYSSNGTYWTNADHAVSTTTAVSVTGLTNGTSYVFRVAAINGAGQGAWSDSSASATPLTTPAAPTKITGLPAASQVKLSWTTPVSTGGAALIDYVVQYSMNGSSWSTFDDGASSATSTTVTGLDNGRSYVFRVAAVTIAGTGSYSSVSSSVVPRTTADAPLAVLGTPGNTVVALAWVAPTWAGGSSIVNYSVQYSANNGTTWRTANRLMSTQTSMNVTGLLNGVSYIFKVAAVNAAGVGAYSDVSAAYVPRTTPSAPSSISTVSGDEQVTLLWRVPSSNGGLPITDYLVQYSSDNGTTWTDFEDGVSTQTTTLVTGLTNGTTYVFRLAGTNEAGTGSWSTASLPLLLRTFPDAPSNVVAEAGQSSVSLAWDAPTDDGGSAVFDYIIQYSTNSGVTWSLYGEGVSSRTTATLGGLLNGSTYLFKVAALNAVGLSDTSMSSDGVVPRAVPTAPVALSVEPRDGELTLSWELPLSDGASAITDYILEYSSDAATWVRFEDGISDSRVASVLNLSNGSPYFVRVAAVNGIGTGPWATSSRSYTPRAVPDAPTDVTGTFGNGEVSLTWMAPAWNGGSPLTDYEVQYSSDGGSSWTGFADDAGVLTNATVTDLVNGTEYVFRVAARNVAGLGAWSSASDPVIPRTLPTAPTSLVGVFGDAAVDLTWSAPASDGGAAISDYAIEFSSDNGTSWSAFEHVSNPATSTTVTNLSNGTSYLFRAAAVNSVGQGPWSDPSASVTPHRAPYAPTSVSASIEDSSSVISWVTPSNDGGATITSYAIQASSDGGTVWSTVATASANDASVSVSGLANGTAYIFRVAASNDAGLGDWAEPSVAVTPRTVPDAPTAVVGTPDNTEVALSWEAPVWNGGNTITDYAIEYSSDGATWVPFSDGISNGASTTVTGLTNGTAYTFRVAAINEAGQGAWSDVSSAVTPRTVADAPTAVVGTPANSEVPLTWEAPTWNGGASITDYAIEYSADGSNWVPFAHTASTSPAITVTGLANGTAYIFRVAAVNEAGQGAWSASSTPVIPRTVPDAPTSVLGTPGSTTIALSWSAPAWNGGNDVLDYVVELSTDGSSWSLFADGVSSATTAALTGLANGTAYALRVAAVNEAGQGSWSVVSAPVTPRDVPDAPTALAGTAGDAEVSLSWTSPVWDGGNTVADYVIEYSTDGSSWTAFGDGASANTITTVTGLTNGTAYTFRVAAVNEAGQGAWSDVSVAVTPRSVADAPTAVNGSPADTEVALSWDAPAWDGGNAISDYVIEYSTDGSSWVAFADATSTATTTTVTGLSNGTAYTFRVAAVNEAGQGSWSSVSSAVTPRTVADAPTAVAGTPGDTEAALSWDAPAWNGGNAISDYVIEYSTDGSSWTPFSDGVSSTTASTVTGLTNGTAYTFRVAAINEAGQGDWSSTSSAVTPRSVADAPTGVAGTPGDTEVPLTWDAPAWNGGNSISDYVIEYSTDGTAWSVFADGVGPSPAITVTGLSSGTAYTFRVAAINEAGQGAWSDASSAVTPRTVADAPTAVAGTPADTEVALSWDAPTWDGGNGIIDYAVEYSSDGSSWTQFSDGVSSVTDATVTGLANGTAYTFRVAAINEAGQGAWSDASSAVTPRTVADAPTAVAGTPADTEVPLTWDAPAWDGGNSVSDYVIEYSSDGASWTTFADSVSAAAATTVTGLTNGTAYTFRVAAVNEAGQGAWSDASSAVTPRTVADAPTAVVGTPGETEAALSWDAPVWNGGNGIIDYAVEYSSNGTTWVAFEEGVSSSTTATVTGLANGTAYTFRVAAINEAGQGAWSDVSSAVTPRTVADAPTGVVGTPADTEVPLTWDAPAWDGGNSVSDYVIEYSTDGSTWTTFADSVSAAAATTVTGLTNGTAYTFRVAAVNEAGQGAWSVSSSPVTPRTVADAPTAVVGTPADTEVALSWDAPAWDGGNGITDYVIEYSTDGTSWSLFTDGASANTITTVTGLSNGTAYTFRVAAINEAGQGAWSVSSSAVTPRTVADAPTAVVATPADTEVALSWDAPVWNGGNAISDYMIEYSTDGSTWIAFADGVSSTTASTVTGLTNGTAYAFRVAAVNEAGQGAWSSTSSEVTPRTVADAPTAVVGTPGDTEVALSWDAPTWDGGNGIIDYAVEYSTDASSWTPFSDGASSSTTATVTGLSNGTAYTFRVAAINGAGQGAWSLVSDSVTPRTVADAPTALTGTPGDTEVTLSWTAPMSNGGNSVSDYVIEYSSNGTTWTTFADGIATTTSATVTGISNGTAYTFRVAAVNEAGQGAWSSVSSGVTPRTVADAPTAVAGTYGNTEVSLTWSAPAWDGGNSIADYAVEYSSNGATWMPFSDGVSSAAAATVTGLTNGTAYTFRVAAINEAGQGAWSDASTEVTPRTLADAPTAVEGTYGDTEVALTWSEPGSNGGASISDYSVQFSTDGTNWITFADGTSSSTSATVTGLTNGASYTFRVAAVNDVGTGAYSAPSAPVTPRTLADAPTAVEGTYGDTEVALTWSEPGSNGGASISDYTVQYSIDGSTWSTFTDGVSTATSATVTGLTNGASYTFRVAAVNDVGTGAYSAPSAPVTPRTLADAPTAVESTYGDTEVALTWSEPASNGGASITDYSVQFSTDGTNWITFSDGTSSSTSATVTGLTNGMAYTFRVAAVNDVGTGAYSPASAAVIPRTLAGAPTTVIATPGNGIADLTWTAPASDGGASISDYAVQFSTDGTNWITFSDGTSSSTSATVTGLTNGTSYTFRVAATNNVGTGAYSSVSDSVTPRTTSDAPTAVTGSYGDASVALSWSAPVFDGGASVTDYSVQFSSDGTTWATFVDDTSSSTSATVTGLANGTSYTFRVAAINVAGSSSYSDPSAPVTPRTLTDAPTAVVGSAGNTEVSLTWSAPASNGGADVSDYVVQHSSDGTTWTTFADGTSTSTSTTVTGLANGTSYTFRVAAVNDVGTSAYSSASAAVTPVTIPETPSAVVGSAGDSQVSLSWDAPTWNGGTSIIDYLVQYSSDSTTWTTFADGTSSSTSATVTGLANGTSYTFRVAAVNAVGAGSYSTASSAVTPVTTPDAPTAVVGSAGDSQVSLSWDAPTWNGGTSIIDYVVQSSTDGSTWVTFADGTSTSTSTTVTGLANGTSYTFRVAAVNDVGTSAYSSASALVTPITTADAPTAVTGTSGDAQVSLAWNAPNSDGGSPITDYLVQYSSDGSTWATFADGTSSATSATVTGLVNGTAYTFRVAAENAAGTSPFSATSSDVTPRSVADAPTAVTGTVGNVQVTLAWTAPAYNGGSALTDYVVEYSSNAGASWTTFADGTSTSTGTTVSGLANGTSYTFRVAAVNDAGVSAYSDVSAAVTPITTADAPTGVVGTAGDSQVSLTWSAPAFDGGSPITDYVVQSSTDGTTWVTFADGTSSSTSVTVTDLSNGTAYIFRVAGVNAAGTSSYSSASSAVTPITTADAPTAVTGTSGDAQVSLTWSAPVSNGGSALADYVVEYSSNAGASWTTFADGTSTVTSATVTGLTNGTSYTFRVAAVNGAGTSSYSASSSAVTPATTPGVATALSATASDNSVVFSWDAPASDGGSPITDYVIQAFNTSNGQYYEIADGTSTNTTATLTHANTFWFYPAETICARVVAANAVGQGTSWTGIACAVANTPPMAPQSLTAVASGTGVTLDWSAPTDDGGASITDYIIEYSVNGVWQVFSDTVSTSTQAVIADLAPGMPYDFRVSAKNVVGIGDTSSVVTQTTFNVPQVGPGSVVASVVNGTTVDLTWDPIDAPHSGGLPITGYTVEYQSTDSYTWLTAYSTPNGGALNEFYRFTGLTTGTEYMFRVSTSNAFGYGPATVSNTVIPSTAPAAPTSVTGVSGDAKVILSWTTPASDGGTAITDYIVQYSSNSGSSWTTFADAPSVATSTIVTGLSNGTAYMFRVAATNQYWTGDYSAASAAVTPAANPGAPAAVVGTAGDSQVSLTWAAPAFDGGAAITDYIVESSTDGVTWTAFADGTSSSTSAIVSGLTNGTSYTFRVAAVNAVGAGSYSPASSAVTPVTTPDAPTGVVGTAGDSQVSLTWSAPASDGGSAVYDYVIQSSTDGSTWVTFADGTSTGTNATVTGLANGTTYVFRVAAVSSVGVGSYSSSSAGVTPTTTATAPMSVIGAAGNSQVSLTWDAPTSDGGASITDYVIEHSSNAGASWVPFADGTTTATSATVTGLTNGTSYTFRVAAVNAAGMSAYSDVSAAVTPITTADAPTGVVGTAGDSEVTLTWSAPSSDGGSSITDYVIEYSTDGTWWSFSDGVSSSTTATVTGLLNGTAYTFRVAAINGAGTGSYSSASSAVTPITTADAPTGVVGTAGDSQVSLTWSAPSSDGGSSIADYVIEYSSNAGASWTTFADGTTTATSATVTGLTNGVAYSFRVAATNAAGTSSWSSASTAVTPKTTPSAPTALAGTPSDSQVTLSWTAPSDGGSAITDYLVQYSSDGSTWTTFADGTSSSTSATVTGLANGTAYTFRVAAVNSVGESTWSPVSSALTPCTPPGAPTSVSGTAGDTQVSLSWAEPASNGGASITDYSIQYSSDGSTWTTFADGTSTSTSTAVTGLVNGTSYTFRVAAANGSGQGSWSASSSAVTPLGAPGAPTAVTASAGNGQVVITWAAPASDGGATISDYTVQYSPDGSNWTTFADGTSTTTSATVAGLSNGTAYSFRVAAVNSAGTGAWSTAAAATPRTVPDAPTITGATTSSNSSVALAFSAPAFDGGSVVTGYTATCTASSGSSPTATGASSPISVALSNTGVNYTCSVTATNVAGTSAASNTKTLTASYVDPVYACNSGDTPTSTASSAFTCTHLTYTDHSYTVSQGYGASCYQSGWNYAPGNTANTIGYYLYTGGGFTSPYDGGSIVNTTRVWSVYSGTACNGAQLEWRWASTSCYRFSTGGATGSCNSTYRYRRVAIGQQTTVYPYCPSGGTITNGYTWCDTSYYQSNWTWDPSYYTSPLTANGYWNGWSVT